MKNTNSNNIAELLEAKNKKFEETVNNLFQEVIKFYERELLHLEVFEKNYLPALLEESEKSETEELKQETIKKLKENIDNYNVYIIGDNQAQYNMNAEESFKKLNQRFMNLITHLKDKSSAIIKKISPLEVISSCRSSKDDVSLSNIERFQPIFEKRINEHGETMAIEDLENLKIGFQNLLNKYEEQIHAFKRDNESINKIENDKKILELFINKIEFFIKKRLSNTSDK